MSKPEEVRYDGAEQADLLGEELSRPKPIAYILPGVRGIRGVRAVNPYTGQHIYAVSEEMWRRMEDRAAFKYGDSTLDCLEQWMEPSAHSVVVEFMPPFTDSFGLASRKAIRVQLKP